MKFVELSAGCRKCRVGSMTNLSNFHKYNFMTPVSVIATQGGTVPHLTKDVLHKVVSDDAILTIPSSHFIQYIDVLKAFQRGVSPFIGMKSHPISLSIHDPFEKTPSGYNKIKNVSVWTPQGRVALCAKKFSELVEQIKPQWYECLCDSDVDETSTGKRVEKSMRNSITYLEECLEFRKKSAVLSEIPIFAPLLGGYKCEDRALWSEKVLPYQVDGYSLLTLHKNGESAESLDVQVLKPLVAASLSSLPRTKPVQATGAYNPMCILELIECGCDIFDSSLPHLVAERGCALIFKNVLQEICSEHYEESQDLKRADGVGLTSVNDDELTISTKRSISKDETDGPISKAAKCDETLKNEYKPRDYEINLKNDIYAELTEPILEDCACYACQHFSKAYIHHLLSLNELLGQELLMIHNLHHWDLFFTTIRSAIRSGKMEKLKSHLNT